MKRLLTLVIAMGMMQSLALASFPDTWNCVFFSSPTGPGYELPPYAMYHSFYLSGDTTISDLTYQKLYIDGEYPVLGRVSQYYVANIRLSTDEKQVYIQTHDEEYLLFDFSLNVGDTCHAYFGVEAIFFPHRFESKKVVKDLVVLSVEEYNGYPSIALVLANKPNNFSTRTRWIGGVGSSIGLTSYTTGYTGVTTPVLLCALQDGQQVYMAPNEAISSWGYKNACSRVEPIGTDLQATTDNLSASSPCYTILGTLAGDDYRGVVIQNGKIFIKQ